jgi:3-oxoacyl-[acyl-carrier protein] reductase
VKEMLNGKTALITGGSSGIGNKIAHTFAEQGAAIILFDINKENGTRAVEELKAVTKKDNVAFFAVDVSDTASVKDAVEKALERFGTIDVLVNNAGITRDNLLMKMQESDWDSVINVNLKSVYNMCHALVRSMTKARKGKIINIASVVGLMGNPGQTNYAASKAGMIGFAKSLAKEVASRNICVNSIAPGYIKTRMTDALSDNQKNAIITQIPMKRMGDTDDIAHTALFLASDMSNFITGQVITVDGGMVM